MRGVVATSDERGRVEELVSELEGRNPHADVGRVRGQGGPRGGGPRRGGLQPNPAWPLASWMNGSAV